MISELAVSYFLFACFLDSALGLVERPLFAVVLASLSDSVALRF